MQPQTVILLASSAIILAAFVVSCLSIWAILQTGMVHKIRIEVDDYGEQLTRFMKREASRDVRAKKVAKANDPAPEGVPDPVDDIASRKQQIEAAAAAARRP